jgi:DNA primase catalytic core
MTQPDHKDLAEPAVATGRLIAAHEVARAFYRDQLLATDGPRHYLAGRGFSLLAQPDQTWPVGYAPAGWTTLTTHLAGTGFTAEELLAAGLAIRARNGKLIDTFRDRIMIPIHSASGEPVAFIGRAAPGAASDVPKYLNSPDTRIFHKGHTLYGVGEQADRIAAGWAPVLVEGPFDVIAVWLAHPPSAGVGRVAVASCGTSLTAHHAKVLAALPGAARHGITVAYDNDPAGRTATLRAWHHLDPTRQLYAASLTDGADPADHTHHPDALARLRASLGYLSRPLAEVVIDILLDRQLTRRPDLLSHVDGRVDAARALAALLTDLPAAQVVALTRHIALRTHVGVDAVAAAVIDAMEREPVGAVDEPSTRRGRAFPLPRGQPATPLSPPPVRSTCAPARRTR